MPPRFPPSPPKSKRVHFANPLTETQPASMPFRSYDVEWVPNCHRDYPYACAHPHPTARGLFRTQPPMTAPVYRGMQSPGMPPPLTHHPSVPGPTPRPTRPTPASRPPGPSPRLSNRTCQPSDRTTGAPDPISKHASTSASTRAPSTASSSSTSKARTALLEADLAFLTAQSRRKGCNDEERRSFERIIGRLRSS
ncbi:hypothetical protein B0A49_07314 [Cryomyces minteri]|uniref:Uncharacterized protein n=1 Tax=Cryomyces minteri TaxID=331657 RepID=A0A4U0WTB9_9PEZI|nr:hypothetical protein B0A49_07314 [Cryomyces minteri]